ncbi:MAG: hypothetical protein UZ07_CHB004000429 [Chlorobi bacterium OLB7]|nr:MAG: hypothetical protein UZ07_CHB004000429 [Chlorobi bacterium OLB7]
MNAMNGKNHNRKNRFWNLALLGLLPLLVAACQDPAPTDYIPQNVVTAYLIVDQPIRGIVVARSQAVADSFKYSNSVIRDADVRIIEGANTYRLQYRTDGNNIGEYYLPDTTILVQPEKSYRMEIALSDGGRITGQTVTPARVAWVKPPRALLQYPADTANLPSPDSLSFEWTAVPKTREYIISVSCVDSLEYGRYLAPATGEKNRRTSSVINQNARRRYNETTRWAFVQTSKLPLVWFAYKWYGLHDLTVYAPDPNMVECSSKRALARMSSTRFSPRWKGMESACSARPRWWASGSSC